MIMRFFCAGVFSILISSIAFASSGDGQGFEALKRLPIQDAGRIKPLDTFARESLQLVYGRESFRPAAKPKDDGTRPDLRERSALEIVMTWFLAPQFWDDQEIVELKLRSLKEALRLDLARDRFTPRELFSGERTALVFQDLASFRETKEKLTPFFQAVQRLEGQMAVYQAIQSGAAFRLVPPRPVLAADIHPADPNVPVAVSEMEASKWVALPELGTDLKDQFALVAKSFIHELPGVPAGSAETVLPLKTAVDTFIEKARAENPSAYPDGRALSLEVHYEEFHPFRWAWILYVVAAIMMAFAWRTDRSIYVRAGWVLAVFAFLLHTYGFALRVVLTGRPPVSNMYESVIWVSWGTMLFAFFFEAKQRARFVLMSGAIVATLCNIVADKVPHILDSSLQPLEPVLRSNLWLTVHVLTITISYSAFFLAWALGNIGLGYAIRREKMNSPKVESMTVAIYRCLQVGVVLLAAGIILGGVWADYSWGRFWGWDPKETWALIALLGYIAILHARLVGWVRNFGMLAGAVIAFNLVIMAWYGVNYVLGAGLHSYGFGAGGVEYVSAFVLADVAYVGFSYVVVRASGLRN